MPIKIYLIDIDKQSAIVLNSSSYTTRTVNDASAIQLQMYLLYPYEETTKKKKTTTTKYLNYSSLTVTKN